MPNRFIGTRETIIVTQDTEFISRLTQELDRVGRNDIRVFDDATSAVDYFRSAACSSSAVQRVIFLDPLLKSSKEILTSIMTDANLSASYTILIGDAINRSTLIDYFVLGASGYVMRNSNTERLREKLADIYC